jgi:protein SCO1
LEQLNVPSMRTADRSSLVASRSLLAARLSLLAALTACSGDGAGNARYSGVALPEPLAKPSFVLTDVNGQPYDFAAKTNDKVALLFFGYTHCPDVCPLHMANIAAVLKRMSAEDRARVVTVFVTTDPERDSPARLRDWLGNFDATFVGLSGTKEQLAAAQQSVGLPESSREYDGTDSASYFVGHGAQVFAFARDGKAYTIYPFGIRQEDWANDLPRLIRSSGDEIRRALAAQAKSDQREGASTPARDETNAFVISHVAVAEPVSLDEAAAYFTMRNNTAQEDTLVAVTADVAVRGEIHETMGEGEMRHMMATPTLVIPSRGEVRLAPNGMHVMLLQLKKKVAAGDSVTLYLSLLRLGPVHLRAPVVPYAELEKVLGLTGRAGK